jgi:hypothetical protein
MSRGPVVLLNGGLPVALFWRIATSTTYPLRHPPIDSRVVALELHRRGGQDHLELRLKNSKRFMVSFYSKTL